MCGGGTGTARCGVNQEEKTFLQLSPLFSVTRFVFLGALYQNSQLYIPVTGQK